MWGVTEGREGATWALDARLNGPVHGAETFICNNMYGLSSCSWLRTPLEHAFLVVASLFPLAL